MIGTVTDRMTDLELQVRNLVLEMAVLRQQIADLDARIGAPKDADLPPLPGGDGGAAHS